MVGGHTCVIVLDNFPSFQFLFQKFISKFLNFDSLYLYFLCHCESSAQQIYADLPELKANSMLRES